MALLTSELLPTHTYPFSVLRHQSAREPSQEGVWGATDFQVVQRGAGANMSVDVGAGDAWVQGDDAVRQGLYHQINDATVNVTVGTAHATLPRIDQVVLQIADSSVLGSSDTPALNVVAGTATSGATLDNRTGAGALPNTALRLADILVPAAATQILTANIRDRRAWARGFYSRIVRNSNASAGNDYTITATSLTDLDTANLAIRFEATGNPFRVTLLGRGFGSASAGQTAILAFALDGSATIDGGQQYAAVDTGTSVNNAWPLSMVYDVTPAVGSHIIRPQAMTTSGSTFVYARTGFPLVFALEELSRQNMNNGTA